MSPVEIANFVGLLSQLIGTLGLIVWYLARTNTLAEHGLLGHVGRLLVHVKLRRPPPGPRFTAGSRVVSSRVGPPSLEQLAEEVRTLVADLHEHREWHAATARKEEHRAAVVGAWSSGAVIVGLTLQLVAAVAA